MVQKSITIKTLEKIKQRLRREKGAFSKNYISKLLGIHYHATQIAFKELERQGEIKRIESSVKAELYENEKTK